MRRTNKMLIAIILIAVMLLGVGYAAIQNITLNITGTATADPSQSNFTVRFSENVQVSDSSKVTAAVTDETNATINVSGLTTSGDTVTATYTVQNTSTDLSTKLSVETTNSNEEYFLIESKLGSEILTAGGATTLTVTVQLIKTPISTTEKSTIGIQITAEPVQPGQEGGSTGGPGGTTGGDTEEPKTSKGTYLPTGFTEVAGTSFENGLTIQDAAGNQYVWIEVPQTADVYPTAGLSLDLDSLEGEQLKTAYDTIEADLQNYTSTYRSESFVDEFPEEVVEDATGLTSGEYTELKQKMLKSVYENGGFYVGKYETGIVSNYREYWLSGENSPILTKHEAKETPVIQADAYVYNWVTCSQAQELSMSMASGNYNSSLMFGIQWDLVMKHLEVKGVTSGYSLQEMQYVITTDSTLFGNYENSEFDITKESAKYAKYGTDPENPGVDTFSGYILAPYEKAAKEQVIFTTGAVDSFNLFGLYDIAGNVEEWTLETAALGDLPVGLYRGGDYKNTGGAIPAGSRGIFENGNYGEVPSDINADMFGFRTTIF